MEFKNFIVQKKIKRKVLELEAEVLRDEGYPREYVSEALEIHRNICPDWTLREIVSIWDKPDTRCKIFETRGDIERDYNIKIAA